MKLFRPTITWRAVWNVIRVLRSGQLAEGPMVKRFEEEFGKKFGLKNVVAVNSGTSALELAYDLAEIWYGDEVIVPVLTCTATNIPLVRRGAKIVFADIEEDLNVSVQDIERKITRRTKAIVFVHFGGNNRGLREVLSLAQKHGIPVVEDAAQAVGSEFWGRGDYACVSTQAIKTLTSGDGGFLVCRRKKDAIEAKKLRWFGYDREKKQKNGDADLKIAGYKYHMNDISAAIGLGNLSKIDWMIARRKALGEIYRSYGMFAHIWLAGGVTGHSRAIQEDLKRAGVETGQHHYRNDKYTLFGGRQKLPNMDRLEKQYFFVPLYPSLPNLAAHIIGRIYRSHGTKA